MSNQNAPTNAVTLGERGTDNSDASYTGEVSSSAFSLDYARQKIREFQVVLQALDRSYRAASDAVLIQGLDQETVNGLYGFISEYESKRMTMLATAEAINAGAATLNALGGRVPSLSIPQTLGLGPAVPFAMIAAIATAATLIVWGRDAASVADNYLRRAQILDGAPPESRVELARVIAESDAAVTAANGTGIAALAPYAKWLAFGVIGFLAWRTIAPMIRRENPVDEYDEDDEDDESEAE